jgi:hypothetical protein
MERNSMNPLRILLAAVGAFFAYMALGFALFGLMPSLKTEFLKYPAVYRDHDGQMSHMPIAMVEIFVSIGVLSVIYSLACQGGPGLFEGARFGALIGLFAICAFVLHNYANLDIGSKLALQQSAAYFLEWLVVGIAIGLIYRRALPH